MAEQLRLRPLRKVRAGKYRTEDGRFTIHREPFGPRGGSHWYIEARDYADAGIEDGYSGLGHAVPYPTLLAAEEIVFDVYRAEAEPPYKTWREAPDA